MKIGFSGTRQGMTNDQVLHVHMLLGDLRYAGASQVTHGMCQGADQQFHDMAKALGYFTIGVPGVMDDGQPYMRAKVECDMVMPEKPFLIRNLQIVREADLMLVTPKEMGERFKGSGVWASIRYTRKAGKPLVILYPDGTSTVERVAGVETAEQYRESVLGDARRV